MSWSSYIDNLTSKKDKVKEAAIWGFETGSIGPWGSSPGLSAITAEEIKKLAGDLSGMFTDGLKIAGKKCTVVRDNTKEELWCLVLSMKGEGQPHIVVINKTIKAFVIVVSQAGVKVPDMLTIAAETASYLKQSQF